MKIKLPKALLVAVLGCSAAYAGGNYQTGAEINVTNVTDEETTVTTVTTVTYTTGAYETTPTDTTVEAALTSAQFKKTTTDDLNPYAVVKTGEGTLEVKGMGTLEVPKSIHNPIVVAEGELSITNAVLTSDRTYNNYTCYLSIGGTQDTAATVTLDNATWTGASTMNDICVGNRDGIGILNLENGSTISTTHYVFAGYAGMKTSNESSFTSGLQDPTADSFVAATDPKKLRSQINISGASKLVAGTSLQFANVDVVVGKDSVLSDNANDSQKNEWPESYFGYGNNSKTVVTVEDGGKLDLNWNAYTAMGKDSETIINIKDANSSMEVAGTLYLSQSEEYKALKDNTGASTELNITEGAKASISQLVMGASQGKATVTIEEGSTYDGVTISVGENGTITNNGTLTLNPEKDVTVWGSKETPETYRPENAGLLSVEEGRLENTGTIKADIALTGGTYVGDGDDNQLGEGVTFTMADQAVVQGLTMTSGTVNISGEVTLSNVTFGVAEGKALTLYITDGAVINVDGLTLDDATALTINVVDAEGDTAESASFMLVGTNQAELDSLVGQLESAPGVTAAIQTKVMPEPTTATLSLLALMGLAARRRRK